MDVKPRNRTSRAHLTPLGKLVALVLFVSLVWVAGAVGASAVRPHARTWSCVSVRPGDTLWTLAQEHSSEDPREAVQKILEENELSGAEIQPGVVLWVPKEGPDAISPEDPRLCEAG